MILGHSPIPASFLQRENRFLARVHIEGQEWRVHVPNSGRLGELLVPGAHVYLRLAHGLQRKTSYDLVSVRQEEKIIWVDARLPPLLVTEAFHKKRLRDFTFYDSVKREVVLGNHRIDLLFLRDGRDHCYVETKAVTLFQHHVAIFPDAPTLRGCQHLAELTAAYQSGRKAALIFIAQGGGIAEFQPNVKTDPAFTKALLQAKQAGVSIRAYRCRTSVRSIHLDEEIPVRLDRGI